MTAWAVKGRDGWHRADPGDRKPPEAAMSVKVRCGWILAPWGFERRPATCPDCRAAAPPDPESETP